MVAAIKPYIARHSGNKVGSCTRMKKIIVKGIFFIVLSGNVELFLEDKKSLSWDVYGK